MGWIAKESIDGGGISPNAKHSQSELFALTSAFTRLGVDVNSGRAAKIINSWAANNVLLSLAECDGNLSK
jgi:hypothetical protein